MCSVSMFIKYVHFVSEDNDVTLRSHRPPSGLIVPVKLRPVLLKDKSNNALPFYRPMLSRCDNQITGSEKVPHCLVGISVW
jgi:hypothetical protein